MAKACVAVDRETWGGRASVHGEKAEEMGGSSREQAGSYICMGEEVGQGQKKRGEAVIGWQGGHAL